MLRLDSAEPRGLDDSPEICRVNLMAPLTEIQFGTHLRGRSHAMKRFVSSIIVGLVLATGLAVASPVDAQEVSRTITVTRDSKVGGQSLTKGEYSVKFAEGKDGELVVMK